MGASESSSSKQNKEQKPVKSGNSDDAALTKNASSVIMCQDMEWL